MKVLLISVVLLQAWCYALPQPNGVATYSYQDSTGKRYGGTYDLGDRLSPFSEPEIITPYREAYIPEFFSNFGNMLQHDNLGRIKRRLHIRDKLKKPRTFGSDIMSQRLALDAARQAYDLTYNSGGYNPPFFRFPFGGFPFGGFGAFNMDRLTHNSAFANAAAGPGYTHQSAIISPANPANPNVDVTNRFNEPNGNGNFYSVSSSSYASSNNNNGKVSGFRGAETVVNDNGKVTKYRVHS